MIQTQNVDLQGVGSSNDTHTYASFNDQRYDTDDPFGQHSDVNYDINMPNSYATFNSKPGFCPLFCAPKRRKYSIGVVAIIAFVILFIILVTGGRSTFDAPIVGNPTINYVIQFRIINTDNKTYEQPQTLNHSVQVIFNDDANAYAMVWKAMTNMTVVDGSTGAPNYQNTINSEQADVMQIMAPPCTSVDTDASKYSVVSFIGRLKTDQKTVNHELILHALYPALYQQSKGVYDCIRVTEQGNAAWNVTTTTTTSTMTTLSTSSATTVSTTSTTTVPTTSTTTVPTTSTFLNSSTTSTSTSSTTTTNSNMTTTNGTSMLITSVDA